MVEQALIDMILKLTSNSTPVSRYGTGWINMGIPIKAFLSICAEITSVTGYNIDDSNFVKTDDQQYVTTVASTNENKKPEMMMIHQREEGTAEFTNYRLGSVGDAYTNQDINDVALGFITFSLGLNCKLPLGQETVPQETSVKLKFKLGPSHILAAATATQLNYFNVSNKFDYY